MLGLPQAISPTPRLDSLLASSLDSLLASSLDTLLASSLDSLLASSQGALGQFFCFICRINS